MQQGPARLQVGHRPGQHVGRRAHDGADDQPPVPAAAPVVQILDEGGGRATHVARIGQHLQAQRRGPQAPRMALEQRKAEGGLEVGEHLRGRRLRDAELACRLVQHRGVAQGGEQLQVLQAQPVDEPGHPRRRVVTDLKKFHMVIAHRQYLIGIL